MPPAAFTGVRRAIRMLTGSKTPPAGIQYLNWGKDGFDPDLPHGYDVRDALAEGQTIEERATLVVELLTRLTPVTAAQSAEPSTNGAPAKSSGGKYLTPLECTSWKVLRNQWCKAMSWTEGLEMGLACGLACIASTEVLGDQLWLKLISPPSSGKSTLCEAFSVNREYVLAKSAIRGFHTAYKTDKHGEEDHSLTAEANGMTLVTKDGDTLLQAPDLPRILSEARDLYDCTCRPDYRNGIKREYLNQRMTWLLCGTSALRVIDESELGARFLDVVIMEGIDSELEDDILWRVANRTEKSVGVAVDGAPESHYDPELALAMRLTGGYIQFLRERAAPLLAGVVCGEEQLRRCVDLAKFVAYLRARPSKRQAESAERELASRLVSQMVRLAKCLAVVLNRTEVDEEVLHRVTQVALDTARGRTLEIVKHLLQAGTKGYPTSRVSGLTGHPEGQERKYLNFLSKIGAVELFNPKLLSGVQGHPRWRVAPAMRELYQRVQEGS